MDCDGLPTEPPWWEQSNPTWAGIPTEAPRGRLGEASVLWHGMRSAECPPSSHDRPRTVRTGTLLGDYEKPLDVRPKKYRLLPDDCLQDPFDTEELSSIINKRVAVEPYEEPSCLFPAFTTSAPPGPEELRYSMQGLPLIHSVTSICSHTYFRHFSTHSH